MPVPVTASDAAVNHFATHVCFDESILFGVSSPILILILSRYTGMLTIHPNFTLRHDDHFTLASLICICILILGAKR
jgi:hypothetical protein